MLPSVAIACAVSIFIVVDFPAPFGPSSPMQIPAGTSRSSPSTAVKPPNRFTTPRRLIAAASAPSRAAAIWARCKVIPLTLGTGAGAPRTVFRQAGRPPEVNL
ncbi:Uncharacterised protein [Mycobacterium tuberculosis]|nr:Uncharacterised protein [Mycobacterium tuberculosis]